MLRVGCCSSFGERANASMARVEAMVPCSIHGSNKIAKTASWRFHDLLHKCISDLALEYLCVRWRELSPASKIALQNLCGSSWLGESPFTIWMDAWAWLQPQQRPSYTWRTYDIDAVFAGAMVITMHMQCRLEGLGTWISWTDLAIPGVYMQYLDSRHLEGARR